MADPSSVSFHAAHEIPLLRYDERTSLDDDDAADTPRDADLDELRNITSDGKASNISHGITARLYVSHFLSTWNSRVFEFGAVLYLATIFPGTLMPMSVYAVSRGLAAVLLSPLLGKYIDVGNRLQVVRLSIGESEPDDFDDLKADSLF